VFKNLKKRIIIKVKRKGRMEKKNHPPPKKLGIYYLFNLIYF